MPTRTSNQPTRAEVHRLRARALEEHIERLEAALINARAELLYREDIHANAGAAIAHARSQLRSEGLLLARDHE
jgi:hypothetical protein